MEELETALLQQRNPESIREDKLTEAAQGGSGRWGEWQGRVNLAFDSHGFTENGVVGDPREASPELGTRLLDSACESLVDLLDVVAERDPAPTAE